MSLSFNIIKQDKVKNKGEIKLSCLNESEIKEDNSYADSVATDIIKNAKIEREKIINEAIAEALEKSKEIEKNAYKEGYEVGSRNGYEDGYKEVYEEYIEKAKQESLEIKNNADRILLNSNSLVAEYMKSKKKEIIQTCINISSKVINKHFNYEDSMNEMLEEIIKKYELDGNIIVKCNEIYKDSLEKKIKEIENTNRKIKIFIIADNSIDKGNVVIEKEEGSLTLGIDVVIEKLKEELIGE